MAPGEVHQHEPHCTPGLFLCRSQPIAIARSGQSVQLILCSGAAVQKKKKHCRWLEHDCGASGGLAADKFSSRTGLLGLIINVCHRQVNELLSVLPPLSALVSQAVVSVWPFAGARPPGQTMVQPAQVETTGLAGVQSRAELNTDDDTGRVTALELPVDAPVAVTGGGGAVPARARSPNVHSSVGSSSSVVAVAAAAETATALPKDDESSSPLVRVQ